MIQVSWGKYSHVETWSSGARYLTVSGSGYLGSEQRATHIFDHSDVEHVTLSNERCRERDAPRSHVASECTDICEEMTTFD
jgi:hypothetical protein